MDVGLALESFKYDNEKCWFEVMLKCTQFPSVNSMYGINTGTGAVYKDERTILFERELKEQLVYCDPVRYCTWIDPYIAYGWKMNFIIKHSLWNRDVSNMVKSPEDVIFRSIGVNDARVVEGHTYKSYKPGNYERLIVRVYSSDFQYDFFCN